MHIPKKTRLAAASSLPITFLLTAGGLLMANPMLANESESLPPVPSFITDGTGRGGSIQVIRDPSDAPAITSPGTASGAVNSNASSRGMIQPGRRDSTGEVWQAIPEAEGIEKSAVFVPEFGPDSCFDPEAVGMIGEASWDGGICEDMLIVDNALFLAAGSSAGYNSAGPGGTAIIGDESFEVTHEETGRVFTFEDDTNNIFTGQVTDMSGLLALPDAGGGEGEGGFSVVIEEGPIEVANIEVSAPSNSLEDIISQVEVSHSKQSRLVDRVVSQIIESRPEIIIGEGEGAPEIEEEPSGPHTRNIDIDYWDMRNVTNLSSFARNAEDVNINGDNWDTSNIRSMHKAFYGATGGQLVNIAGWDLSNLTNAEHAFHRADINIPWAEMSPWDVSAITNMSYMFYDQDDFNADISGWDVSNVTDMSWMFANTSWSGGTFNQDLSSWDVGNVTNMEGMFQRQKQFNSDISSWNVSKVTDMSNMFDSAESFASELRNWDTSNVTDTSYMFTRIDDFNTDLSGWDVGSVTSMKGMFERSENANPSISNWDVSNVRDMTDMFSFTYTFNQDISGWDVGNVTSMAGMLQRTEFNHDLSKWDVSNVENMEELFDLARDFDSDLSGWDVSNVTTMREMFNQAESFKGVGLSNWVTSNVESMRYMFDGAENFDPKNVESWDVSNVTSFHFMFDSVSGVADFSEWDVSSAKWLYGMFQAGYSWDDYAHVTPLGIENWDVSNVESFAYMFKGNNKVATVDFSNWDTSSAKSMSSMFRESDGFRGIGLKNWDVSNVEHMSYMFYGIWPRYKIDLSGWCVPLIDRRAQYFAPYSVVDQYAVSWGGCGAR